MKASRVAVIAAALLSFVFVGLAILAQAVAASTPTQSPPDHAATASPLTASVASTAAAGGCGTSFFVSDGPTQTISTLMPAASEVALVHVNSVEDATWGMASRPEVGSTSDHRSGVISRRIAVTVKDVWKGTAEGTELSLTLPGGRIGCQAQIYEGLPSDIVAGDYVVLLAPAGTVSSINDRTRLIGKIWPVTNGTVHTDTDGDVPPSTLRSAAKASR
jgi:hypothetical protein